MEKIKAFFTNVGKQFKDFWSYANMWYDQVQEPTRFLMAIAIVLPALMLLAADAAWHRALGAGWIGFLVVERMLWIYSRKR